MDARGVDRATALVCGPPTVLTEQLVLALADGGYDVHTSAARSGDRHDRDGTAEETALVAAVAGHARPLGFAVVDLTDGATRARTLEAVVAVMNGGPPARLVLVVDGRRSARRPRLGAEPHVEVTRLVRHRLRPADRDPDVARRLARDVVGSPRARVVHEPRRAGRVAALAHPVARRSVVGRWSW
ncbi:hypothetical protein GCM10023340_14430 [Nocardioides marinquilinus]|uniref:Uncharacterized protein n=1 Tax=Nocardioides marinquilinus TaxID=1210400 RepID=A0ABP9PHP9_9ACTN